LVREQKPSTQGQRVFFSARVLVRIQSVVPGFAFSSAISDARDVAQAEGRRAAAAAPFRTARRLIIVCTTKPQRTQRRIPKDSSDRLPWSPLCLCGEKRAGFSSLHQDEGGEGAGHGDLDRGALDLAFQHRLAED